MDNRNSQASAPQVIQLKADIISGNLSITPLPMLLFRDLVNEVSTSLDLIGCLLVDAKGFEWLIDQTESVVLGAKKSQEQILVEIVNDFRLFNLDWTSTSQKHLDLIYHRLASGIERINRISKERRALTKHLFYVLFELLFRFFDCSLANKANLFTLNSEMNFERSLDPAQSFEFDLKWVNFWTSPENSSSIMTLKGTEGLLEVCLLPNSRMRVSIKVIEGKNEANKILDEQIFTVVDKTGHLHIKIESGHISCYLNDSNIQSINLFLLTGSKPPFKLKLSLLKSFANPIKKYFVQIGDDCEISTSDLLCAFEKNNPMFTHQNLNNISLSLFSYFNIFEITHGDSRLLVSYIKSLSNFVRQSSVFSKEVVRFWLTFVAHNEEKIIYNGLLNQKTAKSLMNTIVELESYGQSQILLEFIDGIFSRLVTYFCRYDKQGLDEVAFSLWTNFLLEKHRPLQLIKILASLVDNLHNHSYFCNVNHSEPWLVVLKPLLESSNDPHFHLLVAVMLMATFKRIECEDCATALVKNLATLEISSTIPAISIYILSSSGYFGWIQPILEHFTQITVSSQNHHESSSQSVLFQLFQSDFKEIDRNLRSNDLAEKEDAALHILCLAFIATINAQKSLNATATQTIRTKNQLKPRFQKPSMDFLAKKAALSQEIIINKADLLIDTDEINKMFTYGGEQGKKVQTYFD